LIKKHVGNKNTSVIFHFKLFQSVGDVINLQTGQLRLATSKAPYKIVFDGTTIIPEPQIKYSRDPVDHKGALKWYNANAPT